jgi:hypothetical protein
MPTNMTVKEFTAFNSTTEEAIKLLSYRLQSFLQMEKKITVITLDHFIIETKSSDDEKGYMASAILCYK